MYLRLLVLVVSGVNVGIGIELERNFIGVQFSPYVKTVDDSNLESSYSELTLDDLMIMLKVVASKFSMVFLQSLDSLGYPHIPFKTYHNFTRLRGRSAEVGALINRERNEKSLTFYIGIPNYDKHISVKTSIRTRWEVNLALEAAAIANKIFPGTVAGLVFDIIGLENDVWVRSILHWTDYLKTNNQSFGLKVGILKYCGTQRITSRLGSDFWFGFGEDFNDQMYALKTQALLQLDFIICDAVVPSETGFDGAKSGILWMSEHMVTKKTQILAINPRIKVMGITLWGSDGNSSFNNCENMIEYWAGVSEFASKENIFIWFKEAIDNPLPNPKSKDHAHLGWWRLKENKLIKNATGYIAKVTECTTNFVMSVSRTQLNYTYNVDGFNETKNHSFPNVGDILIDAPLNEVNITNVTPEYHNNNLLLYGFLSIGMALVLIIILISAKILCSMHRRLRMLQQRLTQQDVDNFMKGSSSENHADENDLALKLPYDIRLEIADGDLEIYWNEILGKGEFGCVFRALIKKPQPKEVALKTTRENSPSTSILSLLSEIKILAYLGQHPNIVSICGAYTAEIQCGKVYVATELCTMGSLKSQLLCIQKCENENFRHFEDLVRWSLEVSNGMSHLSERKVIHADLATRNVLLSSDRVAKITDFGLSRRLYDYAKYKKKQEDPLPWRWMALESLKTREFSLQSDVWSYGVTLWEIFSLGDHPYPGVSWSYDFNDYIEKGGRLAQPKCATKCIYQVMLACWKLDPLERPTFEKIKTFFEEIINDMRERHEGRDLVSEEDIQTTGDRTVK